MSREEDNTTSYARKLRAERIRASLNDFETGQVVNPDVTNLNTAGLFAKCLEHTTSTMLPNEADVIKLLLAMERGTAEDLENVTLHTGATRKLANPLAAWLTELQGGDAYGFTMPAAPALSSAEAAADMIEVYEMALNRDTDFNTLNFGGADTDADRAVANVTVPGVTVTRANLFRGVAPGCADGPYVSQFLIHDVPIGAHTVEQKYKEHTGVYGITEANYEAIVEGKIPVAQTTSGTTKYICNGRTLGSVVHNDLVYQQYLYTMAILHNYGAQRHSAFADPTNSGAFVTNGGAAHISTAVGAVAANALSSTWVQKWRHHMRLRPEEMAARVEKAQGSLHANLTGSSTVTKINDTYGSKYLPMIYAEGSPTHPSYPAGHAVIAGACTTILKMFYAEADWSTLDSGNAAIWHSINGTDRVDASSVGTGTLTIHGELNKIAANISRGRDFAGVHYRTDSDLGMELGEKIAIAWFKDNIARQIESVGTITFVGFDGTTKTV